MILLRLSFHISKGEIRHTRASSSDSLSVFMSAGDEGDFCLCRVTGKGVIHPRSISSFSEEAGPTATGTSISYDETIEISAMTGTCPVKF